jgi:hypothetical protein
VSQLYDCPACGKLCTGLSDLIKHKKEHDVTILDTEMLEKLNTVACPFARNRGCTCSRERGKKYWPPCDENGHIILNIFRR